MAEQEKTKIPSVRIVQDNNPVRVAVVDDKKDPSLGLFAAVIFIATFLGTIIGLIADSGALFDTFDRFNQAINPPPTLCVVGSDTILGSAAMGQAWETGFETQFKADVKTAAIGSVGGVERAIEGGCVHVLAMSEPMTQDQYTRLTGAGYGLDCAAEVGYDVISFVTNINNPLVKEVRDPEDPDDTRPRSRPITDRELRGILNGNIRNWSELNNWPNGSPALPITIWLRLQSGTSEVVLRRVAGFNPTADNAYPANANYQPCSSNEDCLNKTLSTPGSLYWVSVAWMRTQPEDYLRVLNILEGEEISVNPFQEEVDLEEYPNELVRPLYLYVLSSRGINAETRGLARNFLEYVRGVDGQQAVDERYFYNHFSRPLDIDVDFPEPVFNIPANGMRTLCKP
ncbi:MAG: hypothetical protein OHK0046_30070 [Anaerolineae bacterium]